MIIRYKKELLINLIRNSSNFKELSLKLGIKKGNSTFWLKKKIKEYNLDISHFSLTSKEKSNYKLENKKIFCLNSPVTRSTIKFRIKKDNLIEYKCQLCGNEGIWLDQKMPLILDHINGINNDCRIENLRWLCSNCDSIQPTYKGKNKTKSKTSIEEKNRKILLEKQQKEELKREFTIKRIDLIINSNIDFSIWGWPKKLGLLLNLSPQYTIKWVKNFMPDFYKKCKGYNESLGS